MVDIYDGDHHDRNVKRHQKREQSRARQKDVQKKRLKHYSGLLESIVARKAANRPTVVQEDQAKKLAGKLGRSFDEDLATTHHHRQAAVLNQTLAVPVPSATRASL